MSERKLTLVGVHRQIGMCPPSNWEHVFLWIKHKDGRPVYGDAQQQLQIHRPNWQVVRDPQMLWAEDFDE